MNLRQAAEMALEALSEIETWNLTPTQERAIAALRAALAEADETVPLSEYKTLQALVTEQGIRLMDAEAEDVAAVRAERDALRAALTQIDALCPMDCSGMSEYALRGLLSRVEEIARAQWSER